MGSMKRCAAGCLRKPVCTTNNEWRTRKWEPGMEEMKKRLINKATEKYKNIRPCADKSSLDECFTENNEYQYLWFNTEDNSTRVVSENVLPPVQE
jgi:hypothetical protein